jgi:hypothetical protein
MQLVRIAWWTVLPPAAAGAAGAWPEDACADGVDAPVTALTPGTLTPPNPTVRASAVAPPNVAMAVLLRILVGAFMRLSSQLRGG